MPQSIEHKKLTVFDLDGTLLDYDSEEQAVSLELCRRLSARCGKTAPEVLTTYKASKAAARQLPSSADQLDFRFQYLCTSLGIVLHDSSVLRQSYVACRVAACKPYAGAERLAETFAACSDHMAVLTNGPDDLQKLRLAATGLDKYFGWVYTSQFIGYAKPDQRAFEYMQAERGVVPAEWRMVGDDPLADLTVPKRLGAETWWVNSDSRAVCQW
jgi:FMN phosphatase YigB (HAD superfamily)